MVEVVVRIEWSADECARLYHHHCAEYKAAQAELDVTPWWRLLHRSHLKNRHWFHLNRAVMFGECRVIQSIAPPSRPKLSVVK
jgi:hypothetical protein